MFSQVSPSDERILWKRFLDGDDHVLSIIYMQHVNTLYDYGCKICPDKNLVKDCIQEVFCVLIRNRKNLSETDNIRLYLLKALKRKLIREMTIQNASSKISVENNFSFLIEYPERTLFDDMGFSEALQEKLHEALLQLTDRQKEAIYLRFNKGLGYQEISELLNLNYQSSRALVHRAIEKLRELLSEVKENIFQLLFMLFHPSDAL
jgi:RNA polymerase sigma-70 factor (ECF subfamily)